MFEQDPSVPGNGILYHSCHMAASSGTVAPDGSGRETYHCTVPPTLEFKPQKRSLDSGARSGGSIGRHRDRGECGNKRVW